MGNKERSIKELQKYILLLTISLSCLLYLTIKGINDKQQYLEEINIINKEQDIIK